MFIDMTLIPPLLVKGSIPPLADLAGWPRVPNMRAMLGPVISPSRTPTRKPWRLNETASRPVTSDLPTPPLPLITAITCLICRSGPAICNGIPRPTGAFFGATEVGRPLAAAFRSCIKSSSFSGLKRCVRAPPATLSREPTAQAVQGSPCP